MFCHVNNTKNEEIRLNIIEEYCGIPSLNILTFIFLVKELILRNQFLPLQPLNSFYSLANGTHFDQNQAHSYPNSALSLGGPVLSI
ncbi:hypothetical protein BpHYR1_036658 [Brachionus plicatilis]|uniref:Uncharacterized protein n=1 Tax=Brachionus plicatilis TaxID=10195 RepID=A0A3M7SN91_BRAPC|nr:hypothetical protein BpHYR1_036658 [Brachionus plicatilis]